MTTPSSDVAFTTAVKAIQTREGSRSSYAHMESRGGFQTKITPELSDFIANLDMFYLGTSNSVGQPYIQYRGGPKGFLKVIDSETLGFADFSGNRQYISVGNLSENPKAFLFLMDYMNQQRIKVWGRAEVIEGDLAFNEKLHDPEYPGRFERALLFHVEAWDMNCHQHIHRRVPVSLVEQEVARLQQQIIQLQKQVDILRNGDSAVDKG